MRFFYKYLIFLSFGLPLFLTGCVYKTVEIKVVHEAPTQKFKRRDIRIVIGAIADNRIRKESIGEMRNVVGRISRDFIPKNGEAVSNIVPEAIEAALNAAGYDTATAEAENKLPVLDATIFKFWVQPSRGESIRALRLDWTFMSRENYAGQSKLLGKATP